MNKDNRAAPRLAALDYTTEVTATVPARQLHEFEVRLKGGKVPRLQAGQEPVRAMIGAKNLDHGDRGTPPRQRG